MDPIDTAIAHLEREKSRIEELIGQLRQHQAGVPPADPHRRGRKGMDAAERQQVSERMKRYWAGRRKANRRVNGKAEAANA